jgi:hypothetical protein
MPFVAVKTVEQQSVMMLHRTRLLVMRQRIWLASALKPMTWNSSIPISTRSTRLPTRHGLAGCSRLLLLSLVRNQPFRLSRWGSSRSIPLADFYEAP